MRTHTYLLYKFADCDDFAVVKKFLGGRGHFEVELLEGAYMNRAKGNYKGHQYSYAEENEVIVLPRRQTIQELRKTNPEYFL